MNSSEAKSPAPPGLTLRAFQSLGPLAALVGVILLFTVLDKAFSDGKFATQQNARKVASRSCVVAVAALGMTVIIVSGGIDLSVGTAIALSATVLAFGLREDITSVMTRGGSYASVAKKLKDAEAKLATAKPAEQRKWQLTVDARRQQLARIVSDKLKLVPEGEPLHEALAKQAEQLQQPRESASVFRPSAEVPNAPSTWLWSLLLGIATGVGCGLINGALISGLKVVPFIITLGTMTIFLGVGNWLSDNIPVRPALNQIPGWMAGLMSNLQEDLFLGFSLSVWLTLAAAIILAVVLRYSVFGRYVFALGSNEQTARLCGISIWKNKLAVYALGGLLVGLAGVLQFSRLSSGTPTSGLGLELQVIAAVVIGGGSLNGGRGTVLGTLAGAGILAVIESGGTQLGVSDAAQKVLLGVVIISAVTVDQIRQRMSSS